MKLRCILITTGLLSFGSSHAAQLVFPLLKLEGQSNIIVTANFDHPQSCPLEYTNLLSNTNLFSITEQENLNKVVLKYRNVTTNSGPVGSVFKEWALRKTRYLELTHSTNIFRVACFVYTNLNAREEIMSYFHGQILAKFRTDTGDGYDVVFINNSLITYQEYKRGVLDGLFVAVHDPNNPDDKEHCGMWTRFIKGKILGRIIMWRPNSFSGNQDGFKIVAEAEFKEPFDFLKYQSIPIDLTWDEVLITQTNSTPSSP